MTRLAFSNNQWATLARPMGGVDTELILEVMKRRGYERRPVGDAPTVFDGLVAIRGLEPPHELEGHCEPGFLEHPNLGRASGLLDAWPEGRAQFISLIDTIYPISKLRVSIKAFPDAADQSGQLVLGSASHSEWSKWGSLYCTTYDPIGTAQAYVHELAHQKLRALDVHILEATTLFRNKADELYPSPVRKDKVRPISAVLHATYSWLYICELDLRMLEKFGQEEGDESSRVLFEHYLSRNLPRLHQGAKALVEHASPTRGGEMFLEAVLLWIEELFERAEELA